MPSPSFLLLLLLLAIAAAETLPSDELTALLRLRRHLYAPSALASLPYVPSPALCSLPATPSFALTCSSSSVAALFISGDRFPTPSWSTALPANFSVAAVFATLAGLPNLANLTLARLGIWGAIPDSVASLKSLRHLDLSGNYLYGLIPPALAAVAGLEQLILANNLLNGTADLRSLASLAVFDAGFNRLGPALPDLPGSVQRLSLQNNTLAGWIPAGLFSSPAIQSVNLSDNRLSGTLPAGLTCGSALMAVDLSGNLLWGYLPACLQPGSSARDVVVSGNCLAGTGAAAGRQRPNGYCNPGAIAAVLPPQGSIGGKVQGGGAGRSPLALVLIIALSIVGVVAVVAAIVTLVVVKARSGGYCNMSGKTGQTVAATVPTGIVKGQGQSQGHRAGRTPVDKRHASQAAMIGIMEVTPYHAFTVEELEEATNHFDSSNIIMSSPQERHYKGWLQDGSMVTVKCFKLKHNFPVSSLGKFMETISLLRHRHLVSIIGHCIVDMLDNPNTAKLVYLVFETVSNGTLRSHLTEWRKRELLKWPQRVTAAIGVVRGIQFLHTVAVPGITGNDLSTENIMLDHTLTAKVGNYKLPVLMNNKNGKILTENPFTTNSENDTGSNERGEKDDIYKLGLILLEIITGRPVESQHHLRSLLSQMRDGLSDDSEELKALADRSINGTFVLDSLRTVTELTLNCLSSNPNERPSVDDILWNLQYSVQIQDGWASTDSLTLSLQQ